MTQINIAKSIRTMLATALLAATAGVASLPAAAAEYTMKIGTPTINDPIHRFAVRYGEVLEERTDGRISVTIFPSGQLGTMPAQVSNMQTGIQEALVAPAGFLGGLNKGFQVTDAPGFFDSADEAHALINHPDFRDKYRTLGTSSGVTGISLWIYGPHSYVSTKETRTLGDLDGQKLRVLATPLERAIVAEVGVTGVPMPFIEVLAAIQRGTVDGVRTMPAVMTPLKYYDTAPYLLQVDDGILTNGLWVSEMWLSSLPEDLRGIVEETGVEVGDWATQMSIEAWKEALDHWTEAGGTVSTLSDEEKAAHFANLRPVADKFLSEDAASAELWGILKSLK